MTEPRNNRYVPPTVKPLPVRKLPVGDMRKIEAMPKMMNKSASPTPQAKTQRLAKEKDAIAARARAKGLNPSKADIDATYKRNRQRISAGRRAKMLAPKPPSA